MATALAPTIPPTHPAVVTTAPRAPLELLEVPTVAPGPGQVLVHVLWTSSTPLDLHQADGGLLITHPARMGSSFGGVVAQLGSDPPAHTDLRVGDKVFGFTFRNAEEKCHQTYLTTDWYLVSKLPAGVGLEQAVAVSCNLVTAFHALTADFELRLPWPVPKENTEEGRDKPVVVWGAASSVGNYALQVLRHWGFGNVVAVARRRHHDYLRELGARACFDYTDPDVVERVLEHAGEVVPYVLDCIGSVEGTLRKIARLARPGTIVAVMLPVIVKHADEEGGPVYEMDVGKVLPGLWREGVVLKGTRTHFYLQVGCICFLRVFF